MPPNRQGTLQHWSYSATITYFLFNDLKTDDPYFKIIKVVFLKMPIFKIKYKKKTPQNYTNACKKNLKADCIKFFISFLSYSKTKISFGVCI